MNWHYCDHSMTFYFVGFTSAFDRRWLNGSLLLLSIGFMPLGQVPVNGSQCAVARPVFTTERLYSVTRRSNGNEWNSITSIYSASPTKHPWNCHSSMAASISRSLSLDIPAIFDVKCGRRVTVHFGICMSHTGFHGTTGHWTPKCRVQKSSTPVSPVTLIPIEYIYIYIFFLYLS